MPQAILGKKIGMTQIFSAEGKIIPVTVIEAGPCVVAQVKTKANDGYDAIQIGFGSMKENEANQAETGHAKKANIAPQRYLRELRVLDSSNYQAGEVIKADIFAAGQLIDVIGTSKGKGFTGTIKRWNHHRGPMTHGSHNHRRPASAGAKGPARVFKGKKSPGRFGGDRVTVQNLQVVKVDAERNLLLVKGAIPGPKKALVIVRSAIKAGK